MAIIYIK